MLWFEISNFREIQLKPTGIPRLVKSVLMEVLNLPDVGFFVYDPCMDELIAIEKLSFQKALNESDQKNHGFNLPHIKPHLFIRALRFIFRKINTLRFRFLGKNPNKHPMFAPLIYEGPLRARVKDGDKIISVGATWDFPFFHLIKNYRSLAKIKFIGFIHDLIPYYEPHFFPSAFALKFQSWAPELISVADLVSVYSSHVKKQVENLKSELKLPPSNVFLYRLGDQINSLNPSSSRDHAALDIKQPYLLTVGTFEVRKNHVLLYKVWKQFVKSGLRPPLLVIAGNRGWLSSDVHYIMENDPEVKDSFLFLENVDDSKLHLLYENAQFTIFPSLSEGWGLPVAESLAHGKFVIASDKTSIPEIGGNLVEYFDPDDYNSAFKIISHYWNNASSLEEREKSIALSYKCTSWHETANQLLAHIRSI